jgi:hypothetical protein
MASQAYPGADASGYEGVRGGGWIAFAASMLALAGSWNTIQGILAIADSRVYVGEQTFVFSDLSTWGWIVLVLGILQLFAAYAVIGGSATAQWFGIGVAGINAIGQLLFLPAYPLWAITMFSIDILIIYALAVYGGSRLKEA